MVLLDAVIAVLLLVTTGYCWRLNRRISAFRESKKEFDQFVREFDSSIRQAQESITRLEEVQKKTDYGVLQDLEGPQKLAGDLSLLIQKGEEVAEKLEKSSQNMPASASPQLARPQIKSPAVAEKEPINDIESFAAQQQAAAPVYHRPARKRQAMWTTPHEDSAYDVPERSDAHMILSRSHVNGAAKEQAPRPSADMTRKAAPPPPSRSHNPPVYKAPVKRTQTAQPITKTQLVKQELKQRTASEKARLYENVLRQNTSASPHRSKPATPFVTEDRGVGSSGKVASKEEVTSSFYDTLRTLDGA